MANVAFAKTVSKMCQGTASWSGNIKVVLLDTTLYTVDAVNHDFLDDIPSGARVSTSPNLTGVVVSTDGQMDADDPTFTAVTGATCSALAAYHDTGTASTSELFFYFDTLSGFPIVPNGSNVVLNWNNGAGLIWQL